VKILVIGASGQVGGAAACALKERGHKVLEASRSGEHRVDLTQPDSVQALFDAVGTLDAVVVGVGSVPFKPLPDLTRDDFLAGYLGKVQSQVDVVRLGTPHLADGGSFTLTSGVLAREPIATGVAASLANGAVEAFVLAAATELPRGIRINVVSPTVLVEATGYHASFPGFAQVSAATVGRAFVKAVEGVRTGQVHALDGQ
jgi:NAD(P)-dependent dehydrogenase (short-subunit alcohol dehydrogenase family)